VELVSSDLRPDTELMSTITAHLPHTPRTLGSRLESVATRYQVAMRWLQRWNEGLDSDRHATVSELTLRPYAEARFPR